LVNPYFNAYALIGWVLADVLLGLQLDNTTRQIKGSEFERIVPRRLQKDVPTVAFPIPPGRALKRMGERSPYAQADIYIAREPVLVVVDCKAYSITRGYYIGERRQVESRWRNVCDWLNETDARARLIAQNRKGANYRIPDGLTHIVPLVCSSFAEFVWSLDERYFLEAKKTPRVCTYDELVLFLKHMELSDLLSRSFVLPIAD
jgi:hypothetical protein